MGDKTSIEWTNATWNPIRGCSRVSEGCRHCYAELIAARLSGPGRAYEGLARMHDGQPQWTGEVRFIEEIVGEPLRWKKPRRIFVNSMSDLFHEKIREEWIALIWGVMMLAEQHTFQVLTKRPDRMRSWLTRMNPVECVRFALATLGPIRTRELLDRHTTVGGAHIWLGVSVENQATADQRIPILLQIPAAVRWVSYEPALGPVDFDTWPNRMYLRTVGRDGAAERSGLDWIVVGGESGSRARPFDLHWARTVIAQCRRAGVPVFVKQLGSYPLTTRPNMLQDFKGGDPNEWPEDLRVREYPA